MSLCLALSGYIKEVMLSGKVRNSFVEAVSNVMVA